jgi:hypothetical protein
MIEGAGAVAAGSRTVCAVASVYSEVFPPTRRASMAEKITCCFKAGPTATPSECVVEAKTDTDVYPRESIKDLTPNHFVLELKKPYPSDPSTRPREQTTLIGLSLENAHALALAILSATTPTIRATQKKLDEKA